MLESFALPVITLVLLFAFQRMRILVRESPAAFNGATVLLSVSGAMLIDRLILSLGLVLPEGRLLAALNLGRLWLLVLLTPLLIVTYVEFTGRLRVKGARSKAVAAVVWALAVLILLLQAWDSQSQLRLAELVYVQAGGLGYYTPAEPLRYAGSIAATTLGVIFGTFMLFKTGWPFVLLGAVTVWLERLVFPQPFLVENVIGVLWLFAMVLTEVKAQREGLQISRRELDSRLDQLP